MKNKVKNMNAIPKNVPVFGKTIKEILDDSIKEIPPKLIISSNVTQFQSKILHKNCEAIFQERRMMYEIFLNGKYIGYTNCNRMVFNTHVAPKEVGRLIDIQFNLVDLVTINELCEMCTKSLYQ